MIRVVNSISTFCLNRCQDEKTLHVTLFTLVLFLRSSWNGEKRRKDIADRSNYLNCNCNLNLCLLDSNRKTDSMNDWLTFLTCDCNAFDWRKSDWSNRMKKVTTTAEYLTIILHCCQIFCIMHYLFFVLLWFTTALTTSEKLHDSIEMTTSLMKSLNDTFLMLSMWCCDIFEAFTMWQHSHDRTSIDHTPLECWNASKCCLLLEICCMTNTDRINNDQTQTVNWRSKKQWKWSSIF